MKMQIETQCLCGTKFSADIPEHLRYRPHYCSKKCAMRSGQDLTMNGKHLASPAFVLDDEDFGDCSRLRPSKVVV